MGRGERWGRGERGKEKGEKYDISRFAVVYKLFSSLATKVTSHLGVDM